MLQLLSYTCILWADAGGFTGLIYRSLQDMMNLIDGSRVSVSAEDRLSRIS